MARVYSGKRPQNLKRTLGAVSRYLGRHRVLIALVAVLAALSVAARPEMQGKNIVTFACDTGERYMSTPLFRQD